jgi:hypothetical protein
MKKTTLIPTVLLAAAFITHTAFAEMYKWTDKSGEIHYTQTPPPADAKGKDIEADIKLSTGKLGNTIPQAPAAEKKDDMAQAREDGKKSEEKHRDFCNQQGDALKQMTANALVKWKDNKGEHLLTAEEKTAKMKDIEKNIASMCGPEMFAKDGASRQPEAATDARFSSGNSSVKTGGDNNASSSAPSSSDNSSTDSASASGTTQPGKTLPATD